MCIKEVHFYLQIIALYQIDGDLFENNIIQTRVRRCSYDYQLYIEYNRPSYCKWVLVGAKIECTSITSYIYIYEILI